MNAEKLKAKKDQLKRPASSFIKKAPIKSQATIQEEEALSKIVKQSYQTAEKVKQEAPKTVKKAKIKS